MMKRFNAMTQRLDNGESVNDYQWEYMVHAVLYYHLVIEGLHFSAFHYTLHVNTMLYTMDNNPTLLISLYAYVNYLCM